MNKCHYCGIMIKDETERCPLCQGVLEKNQQGETTYPDILAKSRRNYFIFRLFLFIDIVVICVCGGINFFCQPQFAWSLIVADVLLYSLWMIYVFSKDDAGYRVRILSGVAGALQCVILTDTVLGFRGWSVNYVFPVAIITVDATLLLLMLINRRNWQSYLILQLAMILVGIIPLVLVYYHLISHPLLSEIAFGATVLLFTGSVILGGRTAHTELKRRFHIK